MIINWRYSCFQDEGLNSFLLQLLEVHHAQAHVCTVHAATVSEFICAFILPSLGILVSLIPSLFLVCTIYLPQEFLIPKGRQRFDGDIPMRTNGFKISHSLLQFYGLSSHRFLTTQEVSKSTQILISSSHKTGASISHHCRSKAL